MIVFIGDWLSATWTVIAESGPYLLLGLFLAGLIRALVPEEKIFRHMGKDDLRSVTIASAIGVPVPLCSCSVLPTAIQLRRGGASKGATTSFLISTPETGVDSIGVTWALMDPIFTITRPFAALVSALVTGSAVNLLVRRGLDDTPTTTAPGKIDATDARGAAAAATDCCAADAAGAENEHGHEHARPAARGIGGRLRDAFAYGFGPLLDDVSPWFLIGFLFSGLILVLVPDTFFGDVVPSGLPQMLLMLAIAVPLYVCASASTPVAAALLVKGLDPGAALVLLLAGPATSVATIAVVSQLLGRRIAAVYVTCVSLVAVAFGVVIDRIYAALGTDPRAIVSATPGATSGTVTQVFGAILLVFLFYSATRIGFGAWLGVRLRWLATPFAFDPTRRPFRYAAAVALLLLWLGTGLSSVAPGETGFLLRFGGLVRTVPTPGLVAHLPWPIDSVETVAVDTIRVASFGLDDAPQPGEPPPLFAAAAPLRETSSEDEIVTGEENLMRISYSVHYRVDDAYRFRFGQTDPEQTLRVFSESSIRRYLGHERSDESLTRSRDVMQDAILAILRTELADARTGIEAVAVQLHDVHAPSVVHYAYRDVASALEDKQRQKRLADGYRNQTLARAAGDAVRIEKEAEADRLKVVASASGESQAFLERLAAYHAAPAITRARLIREAAARVFKNTPLVLLLGDDVEVDLLPPRGTPAGAQPAPAPTPALPGMRREDDD